MENPNPEYVPRIAHIVLQTLNNDGNKYNLGSVQEMY